MESFSFIIKNPISAYEKKKFDAVSKFFGGMIEKVEDKTKKLTTVVAVQIAKDAPNITLDEALSSIEADGTIQSYLNIKKPLDIMDADLERNFNIQNKEWAHLNIPLTGEVNDIYGPAR